ncbi:MAG: replication protein [Desulfobacterales bacterium]
MYQNEKTPAAGGPGPGEIKNNKSNASFPTSVPNKSQENFTPHPNDLLEVLIRARLPADQRAVVDIIIRKTYGFHKTEDWISHKQFAELTGIDRRNIPRLIAALRKKNIIIAIKRDGKKYPTYRINRKYSQWKTDRQMTSSQTTNKNQHAEKTENNLSSHGGDNSLEDASFAITGDDQVTSSVMPTKEKHTKENNNNGAGSCHFEKRENTDQNGANISKGLSEDLQVYIDYVTDKAYQEGKIRGTKNQYKQGVLKRIQAGEVEQEDISAALAEARENQQREAFTAWVRSIQTISEKDRAELFRAVAAGEQALVQTAEQSIEYDASALIRAFEELSLFMYIDEIKSAITHQKQKDAQKKKIKFMNSIEDWSQKQALDFVGNYLDSPNISICLDSNNGATISVKKILQRINEIWPGMIEKIERQRAEEAERCREMIRETREKLKLSSCK